MHVSCSRHTHICCTCPAAKHAVASAHHTRLLSHALLQLLWSLRLPLEMTAAAAASPIAAMSYVVELEALFIAATSGELLLLHTAAAAAATQHHQQQQECGCEVEEVGVVQGGVAASAWSPDGEQLAVLGYNGLLLVMNKVGVKFGVNAGVNFVVNMGVNLVVKMGVNFGCQHGCGCACEGGLVLDMGEQGSCCWGGG